MDAANPAADPALVAMNKLNKSSKCRACLSVERKTVQLSAQVPNLQKSRTYAQSLKQCTNLDLRVISPGGYLWPMQICVRCCRALEVAMHFVEMALESNLKLYAEAKSVKLPSPTGELKRKASSETLHWNQFSQEFEQFVDGYEGVSTGPIEENVLYMRGAKMPRLDADVSGSSKPPKEDEVILFDVKYDTNDLEEEDENDGSDAKNNETFFESSITSGDGQANTSIATSKGNKNGENNNNYKINNKNGNMSRLSTDVEGDLIQRALYMTLNDNGSSTSPTGESHTETPPKTNGTEDPSSLLIQEATTSSTMANIPILKCNICQYTHTGAEQLRDHYKSVHKISMTEDDIIGINKNQNFKCRPCNSYETKDRNEMQKHLIDHHKIDGDFEMYCYMQANCPACDRIFKDRRSARKHYTRVHTQVQVVVPPTETYACNVCEKVFNQKASLHSHQRFCQVKDVVHCTFCDQEFSSVRKYELHLQQFHAVETLHECEICHKSFKNADTLTVHRKRHSERHFQCDKCPLNYVNSAELRVHYERAHVSEEQVSCLICGSQFQNMALMREHEQRSHQKSKVWRCEVCNFEAKSRWHRRQHQFEHMEYPYKCQSCPCEFTNRSKFRQHSKKIHGTELSDEQLAEMFREKKGYTNRHDAFNKSNNSLEIPGFTEDCFTELRSLGVDYDDITTDLFASSTALDNLLNLIP
ncbi:zinc finger and SCAN domain-containing protein 12 [Drosophila ficusphila]|uniref:zinc finger and SCAN domain-containing protein 12 n=1 Tax=Drosophila ficusphila TaxID=30025 RepID=UPI0007E65617|nr:zinc finger and SCAN domain-containing protein 12 [Drosophila ficusphila]